MILPLLAQPAFALASSAARARASPSALPRARLSPGEDRLPWARPNCHALPLTPRRIHPSPTPLRRPTRTMLFSRYAFLTVVASLLAKTDAAPAKDVNARTESLSLNVGEVAKLETEHKVKSLTSTNKGSITSVQAIYVPADDLTAQDGVCCWSKDTDHACPTDSWGYDQGRGVCSNDTEMACSSTADC